MSVAKVLEISARADDSFEAAIAEGIARAGESVREIREAWIQDMKVQVDDGEIASYQVDLRITFLVD